MKSFRSLSPTGKVNGVKSGMHDKPSSRAREKLIWPQKQLRLAFIENNIEFKNLTFEHLVAGKLTTIRNCVNTFERNPRLRILERICHWRLRGAVWSQLRGFYAAIVSSIEAHDNDWDLSLHELESMMIDKPAIAAALKPDRNGTTGRKITDGYCRDYNTTNGCKLQTGHKVMVRGEEREAWHHCAKCLEMKKTKKAHSRVSEECPYNK